MARPKLPPRLKQRGKMWYIQDGETLTSLRIEDEQIAQRELESYIAGTKNPPPPNDPTVNDLLDRYTAERLKFSKEKAAENAAEMAKRRGLSGEEVARLADEAYRQKDNLGSTEVSIRFLRQHLGTLPLSRINNAAAQEFMSKRRAEGSKRGSRPIHRLAADTIIKDLTILRAALRWAAADHHPEWYGAMPVPKFQMPTSSSMSRAYWLTREQAKKLIDTAWLPHIRTFLMLGFESAARKEAIERLEWSAVDFDRNIIDFGTVSHKKRRPLIMMSPDLRENLLAMSKIAVSPYVIEYKGQRAGNVKKSIAATAERAGLPKFTSHVMKHSKISWLVQESNKSYREISEIVDTTEDTIIEHYAHLRVDRDQAA